MNDIAPSVRVTRKATIATVAALIGFAANSLLCRMALGVRSIDAWSFTCIRLCGGALTLFILVRLSAAAAARRSGAARSSEVSAASPQRAGGSWGSALALFTYAAAFSMAYLRLNTGVGALVLFACVQATMIGWGIKSGERPARAEWIGIAIALSGLVLLTSPGLLAMWPAAPPTQTGAAATSTSTQAAAPGPSAPDPIGLLLMMLAGIAWGAYSLRGRASRSPLAATAENFVRSVPMALVGLALFFSSAHVTARGAWLALASGSVASGLGYSLWYTALPELRATRAAVVQLVVPVLAAALGIVILGEQLSLRFGASALMILGGVGTAVLVKRGRSPGASAPIARRA